MNPESPVETGLAFEGFLPFLMILALGLGLVALAGWLAWREARQIGRPRWVFALLALRLAAVGVLLWMLAGPTRVTRQTQSRPRNVAILVDRSASMGLVDAPDGSGNVSRWAAVRDRGPHAAEVRTADGAVAMLRVAQNQLERLARRPATGGEASPAGAEMTRAIGSLEAGIAAVRSIVRTSTGAGSTAETGRGLGDPIRELEDRVLPALRERAAELGRGRTLAGLERERWLPELLATVAASAEGLERRVGEMVRAGERAGEAGGGGASLPVDETKLSRWDKAESFLAASEGGWLGEIRRKATVQRYEFGDRVVALGAAPWEARRAGTPPPGDLSGSTQLGSAVQQVALDASGQRIDLAILVTDGGQNAGRDPREVAPALGGTALWIVPTGNTRMQRDVILHHTHAPTAVLLNDQVVVDSLVTAYECEGEKLRVELLENGTVVGQETLDVRGAVFDQRVELRWKATPLGRRKLDLRVVPVTDERTEANNAASLEVQVLEDHIRVLVADQFPRWETRYLLNLFKRDERVTYEQLLFEPRRAPGKGFRTGFPETAEEWAKYRVIILGDVLPAQLPPERQQQLVDYVTRGGGNLVLVAGREAMPSAYADQPLGGLLPVEKGERLAAGVPYFLHLADEGTATLATQVAETADASERAWREMSEHLPVHGLSEFSKPRRSAHSLIWAGPDRTKYTAGDPATRSFLSWQYVGAGRVVYLAAPITYQLRYRQGDRFHHRFWGQLLRWAVARDLAEGSQSVRLSTDRSRYEDGDAVEARVHLRRADGRPVTGAEVTVVASQESRAIREIRLEEDPLRAGSYRGAFDRLPVGTIRLEAAGERVKGLLAEEGYRRPVEATVTVDPSGQLELRHPLCNVSLLRETADAAGGLVMPPTGLEAAIRRLDLEPTVVKLESKMPLWNRWDLFWIFIACLSLEWAGRKHLGLS